MKKCCFYSLSILFAICFLNYGGSYAQEFGDKNLILQFYGTTFLQDSEHLNFLESEQKVRPSIGITFINQNATSHDISIREGWYKRDKDKVVDSNGTITRGSIRKSFNISLRYEYGKFFKIKEGILFSRISLGVVPEFWSQSNDPLISNSYKRIERNLNFYPEVIPHLILVFNNKYSLSLSLPFKIAKFNFYRQGILSPSIPVDDQYQNSNSTTWFPGIFEFRLGLGWLQ